VLDGIPSGPVITISIAVVAIIVVALLPRENATMQSYYRILGPALGSALTLLAIGLSDLLKYYSSTTTLDYELDVECWRDDCRSGRISALVKNRGKVVVRDAKAVISIIAMRRISDTNWSNGTKYLKDFLADTKFCKHDMLANPRNPHVDGEVLQWAMSDRVVFKVMIRSVRSGTLVKKYVNAILTAINEICKININNIDEISEKIIRSLRDAPIPLVATYDHITAISPGQRNRLLLFNYEYDELNKLFIIRVPSEYGEPIPKDRICLKLDDNIKYVFDIEVHGEGLRKSLKFNLYVTKDKIDNIVETVRNGNLDDIRYILDKFTK